jgi:hypothetical protein
VTFWIILIWILGAAVMFEYEEFDLHLEAIIVSFAWPLTLAISMLFDEKRGP